MSSRTTRPATGGRPARPPVSEGSYPDVPEPRQSHAGHVLAFLSVMAVLGFGVWAAFGTLTGSNDRPAPRVIPTPAPTAAAAAPVPTAVPTPAPTATRPVTPAPAATATPGGSRVHVVVQGDTLYSMAQRYRTTVEAIMAANGITDRNRVLHVGDRLVIP